jgi:hypothetical protein
MSIQFRDHRHRRRELACPVFQLRARLAPEAGKHIPKLRENKSHKQPCPATTSNKSEHVRKVTTIVTAAPARHDNVFRA